MDDVSIRNAKLHSIPDYSADDLDFQIVLAYPRGGDVINLRATSAKDAQSWMRTLEQARLKCIAAEKRAARRSRGSLG
jgi:hypothetical protein